MTRAPSTEGVRIPVGRVVLGLALGLLTLLGFGLYADLSSLGEVLAGFDTGAIAPALALSLANYGLRAVRWHYYLRRSGAVVPVSLSVGTFVSGLALSVTPGKLGEVLKVGLLHRAAAIPVSRTFPAVVTERLADLVAVLALTATGVSILGAEVLVAGAVLTAAMFAALATRPGTALVFRVAAKLLRSKVPPELIEETTAVQRKLLSPSALAVGVGLGLAAWLAEAVGLWVVVHGFEGGEIGLGRAVFTYATGTLAGALSFLPGGLIATEASLAGMLSMSGCLPSEAAAVAATLVIRVATLWFAVGLGVAGLFWIRRRVR
jgi:uncharacterized protein (TIRG00374 family)